MAPTSFAGTPATSTPTTPPSDTAAGQPLTPQQIAYEFVQLPFETQKQLLKILMSQSNEQEKQDSTSQLDSVYATLPAEVQQSLYAKWDALSDEQRIALKQMNPAMIKPLLLGAFKGEIDQHAPDTAPIKKALDKGASLAERSRAYVQKLLHGDRHDDQPLKDDHPAVENASNEVHPAK